MNRGIKYFIKSFSNYHRQGDKKNIYLFSTARSGSTWLMELIASQPGFKYYDEPLNIRRHNVQKTGMFDGWESLMCGNNNREEFIISYLRKLEDNQLRFMNPPPFRRNHRFFTTRIVFKFIEIEYMINYIRNKLEAYVVFLIRHPIATTISRHELPRLEYFVKSKYFMEKYLTEYQTKYMCDLYSKGSKFEKGILSWCLENTVPLNFLDKKDWTIISYEELLLNSYKTCKMLYERLNLSDFNKLLKQIGVPAANITLSSKDTINVMRNSSEDVRKKKLVTKWKGMVSEEEEKKTYEILSIFNIDAYDKDRFIPTQKYLNFEDMQETLEA